HRLHAQPAVDFLQDHPRPARSLRCPGGSRREAGGHVSQYLVHDGWLSAGQGEPDRDGVATRCRPPSTASSTRCLPRQEGRITTPTGTKAINLGALFCRDDARLAMHGASLPWRQRDAVRLDQLQEDAVFGLGAAWTVITKDVDDLVEQRRPCPAASTEDLGLDPWTVGGMTRGEQAFQASGRRLVAEGGSGQVGV